MDNIFNSCIKIQWWGFFVLFQMRFRIICFSFYSRAGMQVSGGHCHRQVPINVLHCEIFEADGQDQRSRRVVLECWEHVSAGDVENNFILFCFFLKGNLLGRFKNNLNILLFMLLQLSEFSPFAPLHPPHPPLPQAIPTSLTMSMDHAPMFFD